MPQNLDLFGVLNLEVLGFKSHDTCKSNIEFGNIIVQLGLLGKIFKSIQPDKQ